MRTQVVGNDMSKVSKPAVKLEKPTADTSKALIVVGVGASAGGLEALQTMLSNLPTDTGMAFVIAQHLSPSYKSMMAGLLEKGSTIPVTTPVDKERLKPNWAYVCPPNVNVELTDGDTLRLISYAETRLTPRPSVDMLFESIAAHKQENAIGIILSGTGSDGSRGIRAIKGENGIGIVQDPNDAKYDGMPNSAINSGNVDLIVPAAEIGEELNNILLFPRSRIQDGDRLLERETYDKILTLIKNSCNVDFSLYKENTMVRRIERRMISLKIKDPEEYLHHIESSPGEVGLLFNDVLIGVTSFFRDSRAFDALARELKRYLEEKQGTDIRIWCVACSTGEEPYSISMILHEILGTNIEDYNIQIFATDIDSRAIEAARAALYPESSLKNISPDLRNKYFHVKGDQYEVSKELKSRVIFSIHDVISAPPFLRLDLITCRNLLIYFTVELQRQLLPVFHYALNSPGLLMLGQSESIGVFQEQFRPLSKSAKIYESVYVGKQLPPGRKIKKAPSEPESPEELGPVYKKSARNKLDENFTNVIAEALKVYALPSAILVNENQDIIFTEGDNPLLVRPEGIPTNNVLKNIHPSFATDLRTSLHALQTGSEVATSGFQPFEIKGEAVWIKLILIGTKHPQPLGRITVIFAQVEREANVPLRPVSHDDSSEAAVIDQRRQLVKTKEQLQNVIEELETSNEEMQSMNEELQSSNEELQSSNEELETTNEELQSTNEELQTAYAELRTAYEIREKQRSELDFLKKDLEQMNSLLEDAENAASMGSWLWDLNSRNLNWSKGCYTLFGLEPEEFHPSYEAFIGLARTDDRARLEEHLQQLLHNKARQPFVFEAVRSDGSPLIISLESVVSFNDLKQATKVMGSMKDITQQVIFERRDSMQKNKIGYILNSSLNAAYVLNLVDLKIEYVNSEFQNLLGYSIDDLKDTVDNGFFSLFHRDDVKLIKSLVRKVSKSNPGQTFATSYRIRKKDSGRHVKTHANVTAYEVDEISGAVVKALVTSFRAAR